MSLPSSRNIFRFRTNCVENASVDLLLDQLLGWGTFYFDSADYMKFELFLHSSCFKL